MSSGPLAAGVLFLGFFDPVLDGAFIAGLGRINPELAAHLPSREPKRALHAECPVGEPQVEIEAQRRALEAREDVHIEWHEVADDLVEERLSGHLKTSQRWSPQTGQRGWAGTMLFYPFRVGLGKPVLVLQLRGPHFRMWP